jgi:hypothetical protein
LNTDSVTSSKKKKIDLISTTTNENRQKTIENEMEFKFGN